MAYLMNTAGIFVLGADLGTIANVDFAVGPKAMGGVNMVADTQLVQFLLNYIMQEVPDIPIKDRTGNRMKSLSVDGIFGGRTLDAIKSFQASIRDLAGEEGAKALITVDGVVNASSPTGYSTMSGTIYTIVWLNGVRQNVTGQALYDDQVSVEPLRSSLRELRGGGEIEPAPSPNPLPAPRPPLPPLPNWSR